MSATNYSGYRTGCRRSIAAGDKLPEINNALVVYKNDEKIKIVLEVALER